MLSYQHGYHAGNFADVLKHITLTRLLSYLTQKDKPLLYLETHSGSGSYDLFHHQATKTQEYKRGIELLYAKRKALSPLFLEYFSAIKLINSNEALRYYPGSPYLAIQGLRDIDRGYFCELHSKEFDNLSSLAHFHKKIHCSNTDGISALNALLPPPEKRALIFIDPSYEIKDEYKSIPNAMQKAYQRFATGVYCLWYPIVYPRLTEQLVRRVLSIGAKNTLKIEWRLNTKDEGMNGTGLMILNAPFTLSSEMNSVLQDLQKLHPTSTYSVETVS
jgi:23S rRNA (adenine2030-N6)-methyltransferase